MSPLDQGTTGGGEWEAERSELEGDELFEDGGVQGDGVESGSVEAQKTREESERKMRRINELLKMIGRNFLKMKKHVFSYFYKRYQLLE